jgi:hypothetical protein
MKSEMKGRSFYAATDIIKNATEKLKKLSQNGFPLLKAYSYTVTQGDYSEENVA